MSPVAPETLPIRRGRLDIMVKMLKSRVCRMVWWNGGGGVMDVQIDRLQPPLGDASQKIGEDVVI